LALSKELDYQQDEVDVLNALGLVAFYQGDHSRATTVLEAGLALSQALNYSMGRACALSTQAEVALAESSPTRAKRMLAESLAVWWQLGMKGHLVRCLEIRAACDVAEHQPGRAARLFGAASAMREALNMPLAPPDRAAYEGAVTSAQAQLGQSLFAKAWAAGSAMSLEETIEYAQLSCD
jgi:non-specific serine/threonine protein kinase